MRDFTFHTPTKIFFGKGKEANVGEIIKGYGFKKIMLQYGMGSIKKSGLYTTVMTSLKENGIDIVEMGGVEPNPKYDFINRAIKLANEENVELILAVGGGSVIDSAKFTAIGASSSLDVFDVAMGKVSTDKALPVATVLTISAAGSEMSASAVLTNTELGIKKGTGGDYIRPLFSILNPELTYSVSRYQTACGISDIMAHTMERYFYPVDDTPLTDRIAEGLLKSVVEAGRIVMTEPHNYDARATIMWASSLSHNNLTGCGRENALAVHQLEHALSGMFDHIAHGAGLAVLFPAWCRYVCGKNIKRFAQFARGVFDVKEENDEIAAILGIEALENFFKEIGMPQRLREFGIENKAEELAELCTMKRTRTIKSYVEIDADVAKDIFNCCY
ncbi:MAG: iron-containing alcohol dehydrogenase [Clostridia bacterium]|nr:iron-containing alcohol dehydrogenase [Clostridia bacterium]